MCVCVCVRVVVENYDTVWQESFQSHVEPFQDLSSVSSWEAVFSPSHFAILESYGTCRRQSLRRGSRDGLRAVMIHLDCQLDGI